MPDDEGTSDGITSRFGRGTSIIVVLVVIVIASILIVVSLGDQDHEDREREIYSGDYTDYYPSGVMGIPIGGIRYYLNEDTNLTDPGVSGPLPIYQHQPPELETRRDAEQYLAGFGFNVTGYGCETIERPTGHIFRNGGARIKLAIDGRYWVSYQVPSTREWEPNITKEEAIDIGLEYIKNHTGIPDEAIMTTGNLSVRSSMFNGVKVESFNVRFQQTLDGHLVRGSGGRNSIFVEVDAQTGAVERFNYHWVILEPIDEIEKGDLGNLEEIVSSYITYYNEKAASFHTPPNSTINITKVEIIYRNPLRASAYDIYDDCLFYVYLPYVKIEWANGKGYTIVSPLDTEN